MAAQNVQQGINIGRLVVHNQNRILVFAKNLQRFQGLNRLAARELAVFDSLGGSRSLIHGQGKLHPGPLARLRPLNVQGAAHSLRQLAADVQSDTHAGISLRGQIISEGILLGQELLPFVGRNSRSRILYADQSLISRNPAA
ncbi:hypothetical protein D3C75_1100190 [compost metagenome]